MCGEDRRGSPEATARFRYRLSDLKQNGSNILLVGTDALAPTCQRLLGESAAGPRYRLFVTTDSGAAVARDKLAAVGPQTGRDAAAVVDWRTHVRGGTATGADDSNGNGDSDRGDFRARGASQSRNDDDPLLRDVTVDSGDLRDLGVAIEETVEAFEARVDHVSPAELRVCFDSLTPLVTDCEDRDVRRFLLGLTETVDRVDGMAHYHLPAEYDSDAVASVSQLFDAVVEVQRAADGVEQRWHVDDITTDWLPL